MVDHDPSDPVADDGEVELAHADFDRPSIARIYDYHLGGNANFAVDRAAGDEFERIFPDQLAYCRHNRAFLGCAVRTLVTEHGIEQFLDLGSGVPTVGNVHEIAHPHNPHAQVAYVDWEAIACHHARRLLDSAETRVSVPQADIQDPAAVLSSPGVAELLDFTRPVAILALGILDIIPEPDGAGLIARYRDAPRSGSALAISNGAQLTLSQEQIGEIHTLMADSSTSQGQGSEEEPGRIERHRWSPGWISHRRRLAKCSPLRL